MNKYYVKKIQPNFNKNKNQRKFKKIIVEKKI